MYTRINLKTVARKLKLYRKIQMKTNWKEYSYGKAIRLPSEGAAWENPRQGLVSSLPWCHK